MRSSALALAAAAAAVGAFFANATAGGPAAAAAVPHTDGQIVFGSNRSGNFDIWVMNADGSAETNLTDDAANDQTPRWSPDGKKIAFASDREDGWGIFVMGSDGSNPTRLTTGSDFWPAWTADGDEILFDRAGEIFAAKVDGSGVRRVTDDPAIDILPATSRHKKLAFASDRAGSFDIFAMKVDSTGLHAVTSGPNDDRHPAWSPNGNDILFVRNKEAGGDLFVVHADGSSPTQLTFTADREEGDPSWSPTGERIVFQGCVPETCQIYSAASDGSDVRQLTDAPLYSYSPDWGPKATNRTCE